VNERIRELAEQAEDWADNQNFYESDYRDYLMEKFAELIVKECLAIVNRHEYSYHEADPLWETAQLIKERFGVAE
jgi:hypothetical protein